MFECKNCGLMFGSPIYSFTAGGDIGEPWPLCPNCEDDDFVEVEQCFSCDEWVDVDDLKGGLCCSCFEKFETDIPLVKEYGRQNPNVTQVNALYACAFSDSEIDAILQKAFDELPINLQKNAASDLCNDDYTAFAGWVEIS